MIHASPALDTKNAQIRMIIDNIRIKATLQERMHSLHPLIRRTIQHVYSAEVKADMMSRNARNSSHRLLKKNQASVSKRTCALDASAMDINKFSVANLTHVPRVKENIQQLCTLHNDNFKKVDHIEPTPPPQIPVIATGCVGVATSRYSEGSLFRRFVIPN